MKICMITTSDIDYDSRILNEAESLASKYEVVILARQYPHRPIIKKTSFQIQRIGFLKSPIFKLNILSSLLSLAKAAFRIRADIYHTHDLDGLLCAWPAAVLRHKLLIYDSHEFWSDTYLFSNLRGLQWLLPYLERFLVKKISGGITVNQSLAQKLKQKYHKNFLALYNICKLEKSIPAYNLKQKFAGRKIILHLGAADEGRGMEEIISAAKFLPKNFAIVFLGGGKTENNLKNLIFKNHLEKKVFLLPAILPSQIIATISKVDLALALTQKKSQSYYLSLPNKIFQYIGAGVPILGSNFPEFKKIILKNKIGEVVEPSNPKLIAQKIIQMLDRKEQKKYQKNLAGLAKAKYNWAIESKKLLLFYEKN